MYLIDFLNAHGFQSDPFAHTNAEDEELLASYFVPPPYFAAVLGNPREPKSSIVFAPRGGGKTAQRKMLEERSEEASGRYLCVLYDVFNSGAARDFGALDAHLHEIALRVLVGILVELELDGNSDLLSKEDRAFITNESALLDTVGAEYFGTLIGSLKGNSRRAADWMREHSGPVKGIIASLLAKRGIELDPSLPWGPQMTKARTNPPRSRLSRLLEISRHIGFNSVYVLIDRLDESPATSTNPRAAINLIQDILLDLPTMETPGMAIKVFAWDKSQDHYREIGGRPDRVQQFSLEWKPDTLAQMMKKRLAAYSNGAIQSLRQLQDPLSDIDLHSLASYLAHGSPRDMVRLASAIVAEHLNSAVATPFIGDEAVWDGIRTFADQVCTERGHKFLPDLMRLQSFRFNQSTVASDYLKVTKQAAQAKVTEWRKTAMIDKIAEVPDARHRPQHLYGVADPRLAIHVRPALPVRDVLEYYAFQCPACQTIGYSDDTSLLCGKCKDTLNAARVPSLMSLCRWDPTGQI